MEISPGDIQGRHFCVCHLDALGVGVGVEAALYREPGRGFGCGDQLNDDLVSDEGLPAPILGDKGKQTVLDLVPFAGTGWQMGDGYREPSLVGELL